MKKFLSLIAIMFCVYCSNAQKTEIRYAESNFDNGMRSSSFVEIKNADKKLVEKRWVSFLKDKDGKVKENDDEYFSDNAKIPSISTDTLDIYSRVESIEKDVRVTIAVNRNGEFINNSAGNFDAIDRLLREFAISIKKEIINNNIENAEKLLSTQKRNEKDLIRENEKMENNIKEYKSKIADTERDIITNKSTQETTRSLMETQKKVIDDLKKSLENVE